MAKNYIDDYYEKREHRRQDCLRRLKEGEISPVAYYMTLIEIGEADLASRIGISRRKLRRHLTPEGFGKASLSVVERYADVFSVPVANMFQVLVPGGGVRVRQEKTSCGLVVLTHIDKEDQ
jgi:hypothetical protein